MRLDHDQLEELADMLAERLGSADAGAERAVATKTADGLLTADALADRLGVSRRWVYEHAAELGAQRLGDGPKPRLRFDFATAREAMSRFGSGMSQAPIPLEQAKSERSRRRSPRRMPTRLPQRSVLVARGRMP